jgi:hypothetical protein
LRQEGDALRTTAADLLAPAGYVQGEWRSEAGTAGAPRLRELATWTDGHADQAIAAAARALGPPTISGGLRPLSTLAQIEDVERRIDNMKTVIAANPRFALLYQPKLTAASVSHNWRSMSLSNTSAAATISTTSNSSAAMVRSGASKRSLRSTPARSGPFRYHLPPSNVDAHQVLLFPQSCHRVGNLLTGANGRDDSGGAARGELVTSNADNGSSKCASSTTMSRSFHPTRAVSGRQQHRRLVRFRHRHPALESRERHSARCRRAADDPFLQPS